MNQPTPRARVHPLSIALGIGGALSLLVGLGAYITAQDQMKAQQQPSSARTTAGNKTTSPVKPAGPANRFGPGVWTVGVDIKQGTYRTTGVVEEGCYWEITRTGSNGGDIVENDLTSGGRPRVTVKVGQDFSSRRCGDWEPA